MAAGAFSVEVVYALPQRQETDIPAVVSLRRSASHYPSMTPRALFGEIKDLGTAAADWLLESHPNPADLEVQSLAERLRQVSPHWFRHSGASEAINGHFPIADAAERLPECAEERLLMAVLEVLAPLRGPNTKIAVEALQRSTKSWLIIGMHGATIS